LPACTTRERGREFVTKPSKKTAKQHLFNGLYKENVGVGLARDANASVLQIHRGDAIAGKPAPTQASSHLELALS
jgi:hypothetical protein